MLKETITLFEWTKILVALFECLGLLEVNCKETPIIGAIDLKRTIHKILANDDIPHTNQNLVCSPYKSHVFLIDSHNKTMQQRY